MQKWADNIKTVRAERIKLVIVAANNHYAGFAPGTVNLFRNMQGLPQADWKEEEKQEQYMAMNSKQHALSDFLH